MTAKKEGDILCIYLGEELSMKRDSKARGTEAEASFACLGNSKDVSVADVAGEMGRGEGVGDRVVARSQIILKMGGHYRSVGRGLKYVFTSAM